MTTSDTARKLISLGHEVAEAPPQELESATTFALVRVAHWIGAMNAYWIGAVHDEHAADSDPMLGWRPRDMLYAHDHEAMLRSSAAIVARLGRGEIDLATIANVRRAGVTRAFLREELVPDPVWRRSWIFNEYHRPRGVEDQLVGAHALTPLQESYIGLIRTGRERRFDARSRDLLLLFLQSSRVFHRRLMLLRGLTASPRLTPRERDVMALLMTDATEKEIAKRLGLSERTVHQHARAIYTKHNVRGRFGIMAAAIRQT